MQTYELTPRAEHLGDRDWDCSVSQARCYVIAEDETDARLDVSLAFGIAAPVESRYSDTRCNPWSQSRLVEARAVEHPGDPYLTPGCVITDEHVIDLANPLDVHTREHLAFLATLR